MCVCWGQTLIFYLLWPLVLWASVCVCTITLISTAGYWCYRYSLSHINHKNTQQSLLLLCYITFTVTDNWLQFEHLEHVISPHCMWDIEHQVSLGFACSTTVLVCSTPSLMHRHWLTMYSYFKISWNETTNRCMISDIHNDKEKRCFGGAVVWVTNFETTISQFRHQILDESIFSDQNWN